MVDGAIAAAGPHDQLLRENLEYRTLISAFEHDRQTPHAPQASPAKGSH